MNGWTVKGVLYVQAEQSRLSEGRIGLKIGEFPSWALEKGEDGYTPVPVVGNLGQKFTKILTENRIMIVAEDFLQLYFQNFEFLGRVGGEAAVMLAMYGAAESPELAIFVEEYQKLHTAEVLKAGGPENLGEDFRPPTADQVVKAAKLSYPRLIGALCATAVELNLPLAKAVLHMSMPKVVAAVVADATAEEGGSQHAQKLLFQATGLVESGGPKININNNQNSLSLHQPGVAQGLPAWPSLDELKRKELPPVALQETDTVIEGELITVRD